MHPTSPLLSATLDGEPNIELLRRSGWFVGNSSGSYCVAWRGRDEVVFEWKAGGWHRITGHGSVDEAA